MEQIRVSKNLYRGRKIRTVFGIYWLWVRGKSIAWLRKDESYLVRPAAFFVKWDDSNLRAQLGNFYCTTK